jgi:hypothetical protein
MKIDVHFISIPAEKEHLEDVTVQKFSKQVIASK